MLCEQVLGKLHDFDTEGKKVEYVDIEWHEAFKKIHKKTTANKVAEGAKAAGAEVEVISADDFDGTDISGFDGVAFGCPAMGDEELEDSVFQPVFEACEAKLAGKKVALFGSYGWGDGEWMRSWEEKCQNDGVALAVDSVICNEDPDDEAQAACIELGKAIC